jgi:heme-degrading monooxygenase HmoA
MWLAGEVLSARASASTRCARRAIDRHHGPMIVRIWRTGLDEARAAEYTRFAQERSLPMFRRRPGCLGALLTRGEPGRTVVTLWEDEAAVARLEGDVEYRGTVEAILAAGFLRPPQRVEVLEVEGGWLADALEGFRHCNEA